MTLALFLSIVGLLLVVALNVTYTPRQDEMTWGDLDDAYIINLNRMNKQEWEQLCYDDWDINKQVKQEIAATFGIPKKFLGPEIGLKNELGLYGLPEKRHDDRRDT